MRAQGFQGKVAGALRRHIDAAGEAMPDASRQRERHFAAIRQLVDYVVNTPDEDPALVGLWNLTFAFGNAWDPQWEPTEQQAHVIAQAGYLNAAPESRDVFAELVCAGVEDLNRRLNEIKGELGEARDTLAGADDRVGEAEARAIAANSQRDAASREADQLRAELEGAERQLRVFRSMHAEPTTPPSETPSVPVEPGSVLDGVRAVQEAVRAAEAPYPGLAELREREEAIEQRARDLYSSTGGLAMPDNPEVGKRYAFGWGITQRAKQDGTVMYEVKYRDGVRRVRDAYTTPAAALSRRAQLEGEGKITNPTRGDDA